MCMYIYIYRYTHTYRYIIIAIYSHSGREVHGGARGAASTVSELSA